MISKVAATSESLNQLLLQWNTALWRYPRRVPFGGEPIGGGVSNNYV